MKKFFTESEMELVLFGFDVLTTSGEIGDVSFGDFSESSSDDNTEINWSTNPVNM